MEEMIQANEHENWEIIPHMQCIRGADHQDLIPINFQPISDIQCIGSSNNQVISISQTQHIRGADHPEDSSSDSENETSIPSIDEVI